jgi:serine phosphatase RsbU (regulator of sigma subunit)/ligand-binding sensor protein
LGTVEEVECVTDYTNERVDSGTSGSSASPALRDLVDVPTLQAMLDDFHQLTRIPTALIDVEGAVIVGAGWQDVCIHFHRVHPETCAACIESDTALTADIPEGTAQLYRCKNGMVDAASPVIVGDIKVGNLFTGQFFFDDEPPDLDFFRAQAQRYGFDEAAYLAAIEAVPRLSRQAVDTGLRFLTNLASVISRLSYSNIERQRALKAEREAQSTLAKLYERERRSAELNAALTRIDDSIHSTLEPDEILQRVVVEAAEALGCESSALDLREGDGWVLRYVHRFPEEAVGRMFSDAEVPFAAMAATEKVPVVIDDAFADPRVDPELQRAYNVRSVMVAPLIVHDEVLGVLFFNYHEQLHHFEQVEVSFARRLSTSLSLAIETARMYGAERHVADRLQEAMLSLPAAVPGIEFAHSYNAAGSAARVGGDFYDLFELDDRHAGLLVGDVSGKGLDAAVLTSMIKNAIRAHASEPDKPPERILALVSDLVYRNTPAELFATVFFGVLDRRDGRLVYANGGHQPPLVVEPSGEITPLPPTGPLVGAFAQASYTPAQAVVGAGATLVLYTDGLTEARGAQGLYGDVRMRDVLHERVGQSPPALVDALVGEAVSFSDGTLKDDLAILVLARAEKPKA